MRTSTLRALHSEEDAAILWLKCRIETDTYVNVIENENDGIIGVFSCQMPGCKPVQLMKEI
jgi:hypothetical protein